MLTLRAVALAAAATAAAAAAAAPPYAAPPYDWADVDATVEAFIANRTFPGASLSVVDETGAVVLARGYGNTTYGEPAPRGPCAPVTPDATLFDMASCSKIIGGTTLAALLYQRGALPPLDTPVADAALLGPDFAQAGKANVTLRHLLLHNAGYPPDPSPGYWEAAFGCPATAVQPTPPLAFSCSERILAGVLGQALARPPGDAFVYSDLSLITLALALGTLVRDGALLPPGSLRPDCAGGGGPSLPGLSALCAFEAAVRVLVLAPLGMGATGFLPPPAALASAAPAWLDDAYRHEVLQGVVSDENAYASGGVAGHAGVFATAVDAAAFVAAWGSFGAAPPGGGLLNASTIATFSTVANASFSSRALGWDTQSPTPGAYRGCGPMSDATYYHTGYTGTQLCVDPVNRVATALLASRGYPDKTAHFTEMGFARRAVNAAVLRAVTAARRRGGGR